MSVLQTLEDNRCGHPVTAVTVENVVKAKSLIKEDPRIIHEEIQHALGISSGSVNQILRDHLGVSKRCARWGPHNVTEGQKRGRVEWCTHRMTEDDLVASGIL